MSDDVHDLQSRIRSAHHEGIGEQPPGEELQTHPSGAKPEDVNVGIRAGTELVGAMVGGGLLGYGLDSWLGTGPGCFIGGLILGVFTGFWNIYRLINNMGSAVGFAQLHKSGKPAKEAQNFKGTSEED